MLVTKSTRGYKVEIFIAGDYDNAIDVCQTYCNDIGLCVSVERTCYVYTGGREDGVKVTLINYARFPEPITINIWCKALELARELKDALGQGSFTLLDAENSYFESDRPQDQP